MLIPAITAVFTNPDDVLCPMTCFLEEMDNAH